MITRKDFLPNLESIPPLGDTFARLSALDKDHGAGAGDFANVIQADPSLAAGVLRLANSAEFGLARKVTTLSQAVAVLGTRKVVSIALAQAFRGVLPDTLPGYGIDSKMFWRHCISVGVLSQTLAAQLGLGGEEENFLAGLLHDIGKLVLSVFLARESTQVARALRIEGLPFLEAEKAVLGMDHCTAGVELARKWNLPQGLEAVICCHHGPSRLEAEGKDDEETAFLQGIVDVVHMADCLAHEFGYGTDIGELSREIDPGAMERTEVSAPLLEKVVSVAAVRIEDRMQSLGKKP